MAGYTHEQLIDQSTGEFDWTYIKRHALLRAQGEYGNCAPPVSWVRDQIRLLKGRAEIMRRRWRKANGMPDDTVYVPAFQVIEPWYKRNMYDPRTGSWVPL